jgi:hypothetical protein
VLLQFLSRQFLFSITLSTAFATAHTPFAAAQHPTAGSNEAAIGFGSSSIEGPDGNVHLNLGASYAYNWSEHFALLAEYNEQALGVTSSPPDTPTLASAANCLNLTTGCGSTILNGRSLQRYGAAFRYSFKGRGRDGKSVVTPYIITGVGGFRANYAASSVSIDTDEGCCTTSGAYTIETLAETTYSTGTAFGAYEDIGGGVGVYLNPRWGLRAEGRLIRMMTTSSTNSTVSTTTVLATSTSSGNTTIVGGLAGVSITNPATNDDFRAAVSIFYQWGAAKAKQ